MGKTKKPNGGDDSSYKVGYRRPPKRTRFQPGRSGNPNGRPKGVHNFTTDVRATLKAPVKVTHDGISRKMSTQEAALQRLRAMALSGDGRALDRFLALARIYSEESSIPVAGLSADDETLIEIFRARMSSGAAGTRDPPK